MAIFRNDFGDEKICPTLGFHAVPPGETVTVPDGEIEHWVAGGWTPADAATAKAAKEAAAARAAAFAALIGSEPSPATPAAATEPPAVAPALAAKDSAPDAPEGTKP